VLTRRPGTETVIMWLGELMSAEASLGIGNPPGMGLLSVIFTQSIAVGCLLPVARHACDLRQGPKFASAPRLCLHGDAQSRPDWLVRDRYDCKVSADGIPVPSNASGI